MKLRLTNMDSDMNAHRLYGHMATLLTNMELEFVAEVGDASLRGAGGGGALIGSCG